MNEEFINTYIEMNNKKIEELIRSEILLQTRLAIAEKAINKLTEEKNKLTEDYENDKERQEKLYKDLSGVNKTIIDENQILLDEKKKLIQENESLKNAVLLVSENQKNKKIKED
jgi:hypothetical protein